MPERRILGGGQTVGVSFWPFPNSSGWWRLISSLFLTRTSCHKTTHANGYYCAWPGWAVSVSVLPLTTPPWETSYSRYYLGIRAEVSFFCNFFLQSRSLFLPDLSQGIFFFFCLKPVFMLVKTAIYFETIGSSQRWNRKGPNRKPNRMVITGPQKQEATFGVRAAGSVAFFFFRESCAPGILCLVWSYHPPPGWGLQFCRRTQRHCYACFSE